MNTCQIEILNPPFCNHNSITNITNNIAYITLYDFQGVCA